MATKLYDAIVSTDSKLGDYALPSEAFDDGKISVYVRNGTYNEIKDIKVPDGGTLVGESAGGTIINFGATAHSVISYAAPVAETDGTIAVTKNSATIAGDGTSFTDLKTGYFIAINSNYYKIATITDDTSLELEDVYRGCDQKDLKYKAHAMLSAVNISNITVTGSTTYGVYIGGVRLLKLSNLILRGNVPNLYFDLCGDGSADGITSSVSSGIGITYNDCVSLSLSESTVMSSTSHGVALTGSNQGLVFDDLETLGNGGSGLYASGSASDIAICKSVSKSNVASGYYFGGSTRDAIISACTMQFNGAHGAELAGKHNMVTSNIVLSNVGSGIMLTGDESTVSNNVSGKNVDGVRISGDTNSVCSNVLRENSDVGIHIMTGASDNLAGLNILSSNISGSINDEGTNTDTPNNKG